MTPRTVAALRHARRRASRLAAAARLAAEARRARVLAALSPAGSAERAARHAEADRLETAAARVRAEAL